MLCWFLVCFVETPIKCLVVLIACLFSPFCRAHPSEYTFMAHTRSLLANMDPASLPGSSSIEGAILLKAYYKLHHCHSLSASPHPPCAVYTPLWYICPAISPILLINKQRRWHRLSPLASLSYSEAPGVQQDKEETHLISWARRCIGAITQHNEGNVQHVNSAWGCSELPGAQNSLLFSAWPA